MQRSKHPVRERKEVFEDDLAELVEDDTRFLDSLLVEFAPLVLRGKDSGANTKCLGVLDCIDVHSLARCERLCKRARELVSVEHVWTPRVHRICSMWGLKFAVSGSWRWQFFSHLRPRSDGIYVGECRYKHRIRPGSSMEAKLMNKSFHWVQYRRCFRLLPPSSDGMNFALVLRDVSPYEAAAEVLSAITEQEARDCAMSANHGYPADTRSSTPLRARVSCGTYRCIGSRLEIRFSVATDQYFIALNLSHGCDQRFSGCLEWLEYCMTDTNEEVTHFDLGRSAHGGFGPRDGEKDHYPAMYVRACKALEHFL